MRIFNKIWGFILIVLLTVLASPNKSFAQDYVTDQDFYDELEPYGTWVYNPDYGNVWVPDVEDGFQPYSTRGHWVMTSYGNTWVSDYDWGWAPFHYGRWTFDNYYGWMWVPGYEWAPAWVTWRQGGGYYGWAPLTPGFSIGMSFSNYDVPDYYWTCAPEAYIADPYIYNYYVPYSNRVTIIRRTTYINNTYVYNNRRYYSGPRVDDVRRVTGREVRVYNINNSRRPVSGGRSVRDNSLNIYRPAVRRVDNAKPSRVVDGNAYRRANPDAVIADRSRGINKENVERLTRTARSEQPASNVVRVNNDKPESRASRRIERTQNRDVNVNGGGVRNNNSAELRNTDNNGQRAQRDVTDQQRRQNVVQRQQADQNREIQRRQADQQQDQQRQQQAEQLRGRRDQQQTEAQRQQQLQQRQQQAEQQRQQREQQMQQQREAQRQQQDQQRQQQAEQQRQQREQQMQQQREAQRQQQDQQRQQQAEQQRQQREQQMQQQREAQRQQQDQQRQQQAEQQRQQREQQVQQQREAQRQQQEQQRQQIQQQRELQRQQQQPRSEGGGGRGRRN